MSAQTSAGWIGVDLDGTLAVYDTWRGVEHIGAPITRMVDRVKAWLAEGREVRIMTARVYFDDKDSIASAVEARFAIEAWCEEQFGRKLRVTCTKDYHMTELWDDRAVQVIPNTGMRADGALERTEIT